MITGKLILNGKIKLESPLLIGNGEKERCDNDVLLDNEGNPFIPASSFIGVLRHHIKLTEENQDLENFWGFTKDNLGSQSSIACMDLFLTKEFKIVIRDGIKIDNKTGIVEEKKKYDYEIVERGAVFDLNIEISLHENEEQFAKQMMGTICKELEKSKVNIGAKTNSGFGKIKLIEKKIYEFDFKQKKDVLRWLKQDLQNSIKTELPSFEIRPKEFIINANFKLKNSLIIRSYPSSPEMPDAVHIKSGNDYVLPGTSLKGAIRARAERILKTLNKSDSLLHKLFGNVDDENRAKNAIKGKIRIDESILPAFVAEIQPRIKIDRFTGGTIESALFDSMPLFTDFNDKVINTKIVIRDFEDYQAGLILLVLKDLWTGDLAVGGEKNVGRGVFEGASAEIVWNDNSIDFKNIAALDNDSKEKLNKLVQALVEA